MTISHELTPVTDLSEEFISKVKDNIKNHAPQGEADEKKIEKFIKELSPAASSVRLSQEESNFLQSWRLEEYVSIVERMKESDPEQYRAHQKALMAAEDSGEFGANIKARFSAYRWAYGDALDKIYRKTPGTDVFIQSPQDNPDLYPKDYRNSYQKKNNTPYVVVTTDELRLLLSKRAEDRKEQEKLLTAICERVQNG